MGGRRTSLGGPLIVGLLAATLAVWLVRLPAEPEPRAIAPARAALRTAPSPPPAPAPAVELPAAVERPASGAVEAEPEPEPDSGWRTVSCAIPEELPARGHVWVWRPDLSNRRSAGIHDLDGSLELELRVDDTLVVLETEGYEPLTLVVRPDGGCSAATELRRRDVVLVISVRTESGAVPAGEVHVMGCGVGGVGPDHEELVSAGEPCAVTAFHRQGLLTARSEPVWLEPAPGEHIDVELVVPDGPPAGMGIMLEAGDDGILVTDVVPGAPADRAGLGPDDVILAIDGLSTEAMSLEEFIRLGVGTAGTEVSLDVLGPDGERQVVMVREVLDG